VSRYADPDQYEDDMRQAYEESQRAEWDSDLAALTELQRCETMRRYGKESARRRKLFARARATLEAAARVRGRRVTFNDVSGDAQSLGVNRRGISIGLQVNIGPDHDMQWTPRGGFVICEIEPIPF
jgi:hypothetical protein